ncbi:MAG: glycoside hydrolase [Phycisphaerales bacterium]|nr:glycoside hydrolase [Phycisphaerales bacterium]
MNNARQSMNRNLMRLLLGGVMTGSAWASVQEEPASRPPHLDHRTTAVPWIDLSDMTEWREEKGHSGQLHRAAVVMDDASSVRFDSAPGQSTTAIIRSGDGQPPVGPIEQAAVLGGTIIDAELMSDGRIVVLLHDTVPGSPTEDDIVLWVGSLDDVRNSREGDFTARLAATGDGGPMGGDININPGSVIVRVRVDLDGSVYRRFRVLTLPREMEARVPTRGHDLPLIDLDAEEDRQVIVDREDGQYLGHPTTVLLEDGRTMLCVYPKGHGKGGVVYKRSDDGGLTWSDRLPVPDNWSGSREVPTLHRVIDPETGDKGLIMWSGLHPARLARSDDDGQTWSSLEPVGDWGGIVVMGFVEELSDGRSLAMFHDDGRFFTSDGQRSDPVVFTLYKTFSDDGGRTWSQPESVWSGSDVHLCEPGVVRSPDGQTLAILLRENSRRRNSHVMFSTDEGTTWSSPRELPASLTGDRHTAVYGPDGRLFISFRDTTHESSTQGDWVGWVGTWNDIQHGTPGQYRVRLKDNKHRWDTAYPGVEILPDGTIVTTTYGHWDEGEQPYIRSVRFTLDEIDERAAAP